MMTTTTTINQLDTESDTGEVASWIRQQVCLSNLPQSLVLILLQYLDAISLCRFEQTCRQFRRLIQQPFKNLVLSNDDNEDDDYKNTTAKMNNEGSNAASISLVEQENSDSLAFHMSQLCWKPLFYQRFKMHSHQNQEMQNSQPHYFKAMYMHRHQIEWTTYEGLLRLDDQTDQTRLVFFTTHLVNVGRDVVDLLWRVWTTPQHPEPISVAAVEAPSVLPEVVVALQQRRKRHNNKTANDNIRRWELHRMYARSFLRLVHCVSVLEDIMLCFIRFRSNGAKSQEEAQQTSNGYESVSLSGPRQGFHGQSSQQGGDLEELMILVSSMFYDFHPNAIEDTTSACIRQSLDDIANQVLQKLQSTAGRIGGCMAGSPHDTRQLVDALNDVLFVGEDQQQLESTPTLNNNPRACFVGNEQDYYNSENSLLHTAIRKRTGLPLTLAVLYQCIGRRLGLSVAIVGLPGQVVVYLPDLDQYIDVFRGGQWLTLEDCVQIVASYGFAMNPIFLQPLGTEDVLQRVCNNLENASFHHQHERMRTVSSTARQRVIVTTMRAIIKRPDRMQLAECRNLMSLAWVAEHTSDPGMTGMW